MVEPGQYYGGAYVLRQGMQVEVLGLVGREDLNGQIGTLRRLHVRTGRWAVDLGPSPRPYRPLPTLKAANLRPVNPREREFDFAFDGRPQRRELQRVMGPQWVALRCPDADMGEPAPRASPAAEEELPVPTTDRRGLPPAVHGVDSPLLPPALAVDAADDLPSWPVSAPEPACASTGVASLPLPPDGVRPDLEYVVVLVYILRALDLKVELSVAKGQTVKDVKELLAEQVPSSHFSAADVTLGVLTVDGASVLPLPDDWEFTQEFTVLEICS